MKEIPTRTLLLVITACLTALMISPGWGRAAVPDLESPSSAVAPLDEILVTGEQPGPGMWRVSKADHDLWILATLAPLPKKMIWRSREVEDRIAHSQAVLAPPQIDADIGFFRGLTLLPSLLKARKNPDGETLEQSVPHDIYIRWLALRVKYLGMNGDEHIRPMLAALDLYLRALDQSGLTNDENVWDIVEQTAKRDHVPVVPVTLKLPIEDPKGSIRELAQIPREAEIACLTKVIERLETDLQPMRQRANFWARGDISGLRSLPYPDEQLACLDAFLSAPKLRETVEHARAQLIDAWLAAAKTAIDKNPSTFAVLPITELLKPGGWLVKLRADGYAVQEP